MAIRRQCNGDQPAQPVAPAPPAHSILVMVRRFGQWAMEIGYQHISSCQAGRYYPTYYVMAGGVGNGEWRRTSCTNSQGAPASSKVHLGSVLAPSPAME